MIETLNSFGISNGMITSTVITVILCVLAVVAGRRLQTVPSGFQNLQSGLWRVCTISFRISWAAKHVGSISRL